jgi:hypothetical protein
MVIDGSSQEIIILFLCAFHYAYHMVINGSIVQKDDFAASELEGERINFPIRFVKQAKLDEDKSERIERLLLVICPGRYRLLTETSEVVDKLRVMIEEIGVPGGVLDETETNIPASARSRLITCTVTRPRPSWRLLVPKVAILLAPGERSHVFLLIVRGYVELWFPDTLRQATSKPLSELLGE